MSSYLGLDGGGSSLRALCVSEAGQPVFESRVGAANWAQMSRSAFRGRVEESLAGAPRITASCGCFAGILTDEDRADCAGLLREVSGAPALVAPDYEAGLAASGEDCLCLVIAGTGSLICSRSGGKIQKTSGCGPLLGDEGSVYSICRKLFVQVIRDPKSWGSAAWTVISDAFGATTPEEAVRAFYADEDRAAKTCGLITVIAKEWDVEERLQDLVYSELSKLASLTTTHIASIPSPRGSEVWLMGGLWAALPPAIPLFESLISASLAPSPVSIRLLTREPVWGAVKMAREFAARITSSPASNDY